MTRRNIITLILVVALGWGAARVLQGSGSPGRDVGTNQIAAQVRADRDFPAHDVANPTLTLVVFTDYRCPACRAANPHMQTAVARDGHVRVIYRDWPIFGPPSLRAARVAMASDRQGIYAKVHDGLMRTPMPLDDAAMQNAVERAGGNWAMVVRDIGKHGADIERRLARTRTDAFGLGLSGTPSYLAGSILVEGALDEAEFAEVFEKARAVR